MSTVKELCGECNMTRFAKFEFVVSAFAQSPDPKQEAAKLQPGAYYWTGVVWQPLEPLTWSANGVDKEGKLSLISDLTLN